MTQKTEREADLGVKHDCAEDAGVVHGLAEVVERLLVVLVGAVGEVEARDVHAGAEQLLEHGHGAGGRAERADELGLGHPRVAGAAVQVRQDLRHVDVCHRAPLRISLPLCSAVRDGGMWRERWWRRRRSRGRPAESSEMGFEIWCRSFIEKGGGVGNCDSVGEEDDGRG